MNPIFYLKGINGQLSVFNDHLEIKRKGFFGFMSHGLAGDKSIPFSSIKSVQFKKGSMFVNGFLQFGIAGAIEKRGGINNAVDDENAIVITKKDNKIAEDIKAYIENAISQSAQRFATPIIQSTPADEVLKLKQLLDAGVLTSEEFEIKKKQILGL